jgi:3'-phosphoadenosine 5'-phosphosulfate sulfotransferase (PAPS reductase)/FAD synthetase
MGECGMKYIAMISGGQDSTAMTLRLLELGEPVDYIVFCDTGLEFNDMYEYIDKLDLFFQRKYGKKIIRLHPKNDFEHWTFGETTKGENIGMIRGTPRVSLPCFWRREAKEYPLTRWLKENNITAFTKYVGYTASETKRASRMEEFNYKAPLIKWNWDESDVQKYLKQNMMENKLYQHFSRTGCAVCPKQRLDDKYIVWKHYKKEWDYMVDVERRLKMARELKGEKHSPAWHDLYFVDQLEKMFKRKDRTPTFQFQFEAVQDCFCKI